MSILSNNPLVRRQSQFIANAANSSGSGSAGGTAGAKLEVVPMPAPPPPNTLAQVQHAQQQPLLFKQLEIQDPTIWGPPLWSTLHTMAANYETYFLKPVLLGVSVTDASSMVAIDLDLQKQVEEQYINFFGSQRYVIPCSKCREHFSIFWEENPIETYTSREPNRPKLDEWVTLLHNRINKMHNVEEWSIEKVRSVYDNTKTFVVESNANGSILKSKQSAAAASQQFLHQQNQKQALIFGGVLKLNTPMNTNPSNGGISGRMYFQTHQNTPLLKRSISTVSSTTAAPIPTSHAKPKQVPSFMPTRSLFANNNGGAKFKNGIKQPSSCNKPKKKSCGCRR